MLMQTVLALLIAAVVMWALEREDRSGPRDP